MRCELAFVQEALAHMQREQLNLQGHLAKQEQSLTKNQTEIADFVRQLAQLKCDKQQEEQHAQVQAQGMLALVQLLIILVLILVKQCSCKSKALCCCSPGAAEWQQEAADPIACRAKAQ